MGAPTLRSSGPQSRSGISRNGRLPGFIFVLASPLFVAASSRVLESVQQIDNAPPLSACGEFQRSSQLSSERHAPTAECDSALQQKAVAVCRESEQEEKTLLQLMAMDCRGASLTPATEDLEQTALPAANTGAASIAKHAATEICSGMSPLSAQVLGRPCAEIHGLQDRQQVGRVKPAGFGCRQLIVARNIRCGCATFAKFQVNVA